MRLVSIPTRLFPSAWAMLLCGLLASLPGFAATTTGETGGARAPTWATPLNGTFNLYRMSPTLYRSALPARANRQQLEKLGVRTVISFIEDSDAPWLGDSSVQRVNIPLHADRVDDADVIEVLRAVQRAQANGPVLIHCKHGRDRTGLMAAMYRQVIEGWSKQAALDEMQHGGFGDPRRMEDAIAYVESADAPAIRRALANGDCSTSPFSTCLVQGWLQQRVEASAD
ncbi:MULTISPECIES: dual specificity protein phosphatase family protein [Pseudomonas]|uniref:dual specificity protein phosphatase family protein n=1 Tax=Pseudomonas TaxID=286 RepID=UPI00249AF2E9|nr:MULTISPECIES: dual specificity protein phosphatase family protein [Pseudomonas]